MEIQIIWKSTTLKLAGPLRVTWDIPGWLRHAVARPSASNTRTKNSGVTLKRMENPRSTYRTTRLKGGEIGHFETLPKLKMLSLGCWLLVAQKKLRGEMGEMGGKGPNVAAKDDR